jgi:hypothetical protein
MSDVFNLPDWANNLAGSFFSGSTDGSNRDVTLPAEGDVSPAGQMHLIVNAADAAENLVIKDDGGATIATANQNEAALVYNAGVQGETESSWVLVALFTIALS